MRSQFAVGDQKTHERLEAMGKTTRTEERTSRAGSLHLDLPTIVTDVACKIRQAYNKKRKGRNEHPSDLDTGNDCVVPYREDHRMTTRRTLLLSALAALCLMGTTASGAAARDHKCAWFNAEDSCIDCGHDESLDFSRGSFSVECWFRTTQSAYKGEHGRAFLFAKYGHLSAAAQNGYEAWIANDGKLTVFIYDGVKGVSKASAPGYNDGQWHHFVMVKDAENSRLYNYIDGKGGSATDRTGDISTTIAVDGLEDKSRHHFFVGGRKMRSCFNGAIDRVRVYARALTADEIAHNCEYPGGIANEKALVLRLDFDEVQGTTCKDKSVCGNDGKMHHVTCRKAE